MTDRSGGRRVGVVRARGAERCADRKGRGSGSPGVSGGEGGRRRRRGDELWEEGARELARSGLLRELPPPVVLTAGADGPGAQARADGRGGGAWGPEAGGGDDAREAARGGRAAGPGRRLILCSNDYLALSRDPRVKAAAAEAMKNAGCGSSGSRLLSGNSKYHAELEEELARFTGYEACLLFGSGYHANAGAIPAMAEKLDVILSDELNHASIIDGCRLARVRTLTYRHCDPAHLDELLGELERRPVTSVGEGPGCARDRRSDAGERTTGAGGRMTSAGGQTTGAGGRMTGGSGRPRALVITEGVFSMDGDVAPLQDLAAVADRHGAVFMVDDAHGFGVLGPTGRGTPQERDAAEGVDIYIATLGKALGSMGGFMAGSKALINYLTSTARSLLYSTALPPSACAAASAALRIVECEGGRRERLRGLSSLLGMELRRAGFDTRRSETHIVPVMAPGNGVALELVRRLEGRGYFTRAIRYPTVPRGSERVRISLRCDFTEEEVLDLAAALKEEGTAMDLIPRRSHE